MLTLTLTHRRHRTTRYLLALLTSLILSTALFAQNEASPQASSVKRIALLAGNPSHGYGSHEHLAGCRILAAAIEQTAEGVECAVYDHGWPQDDSVLDDVACVVMYCDGGGGHPALQHLPKLEQLMQRGVGFVCLHYAVEVPQGEGGAEFLRWLGSYFETDWSVNPHWTANFETLPDHPVTGGVAPFAANDEWYFHMRFRPDMQGVTPILTAVAPQETMLRPDGPHSGNTAVRKEVAQGVPQHVAWVFERENGGRSFGFTGGHYHWNWGRREMVQLVSNAIVWCAGAQLPSSGLAVQAPSAPQLKEGQDEEIPTGFQLQDIEREFKL